MLRRLLCSAPAAAFAMLLLGASFAWAGMGQPSPGEMGLQGAATPVAEAIHSFYDFVNIIIVAITVFVMLLLLYVIYRFNERANPTPSTVTHNTILEVAWTVVPILILVAIAIPSFRLLNLQYSYPKADLDPEGHRLSVVLGARLSRARHHVRDAHAAMKPSRRGARSLENLPAPRNLAVDNEVDRPASTRSVTVLITAAPDDVIHDWTIPSFGSKVDAVPGRITSHLVQADRRRHLLRPVLGAVRQGPRLHADRACAS